MEQRGGIWQAALVAVAGHAALLGYLGGRTADPGLRGAASPAPASFQFRSIPAPDHPHPARLEAPPSLDTQAAASRALSQAVSVNPAQPAPAEAATAQPEALPDTTTAAVAAAPDAPYLPRGQLTVPPRVLGPVDVPFPEDVNGFVDLRVRLTLFIDEEGTVQRVRVDSAELHPSFHRILQQTFGAARFAAGELHGQPVRSQMRLEVDFAAPNRRRAGS